MIYITRHRRRREEEKKINIRGDEMIESKVKIITLIGNAPEIFSVYR